MCTLPRSVVIEWLAKSLYDEINCLKHGSTNDLEITNET